MMDMIGWHIKGITIDLTKIRFADGVEWFGYRLEVEYQDGEFTRIGDNVREYPFDSEFEAKQAAQRTLLENFLRIKYLYNGKTRNDE